MRENAAIDRCKKLFKIKCIWRMLMNFKKSQLYVLGALCCYAMTFGATQTQASTITLNLDTVFSSGSTAPDGPSPYGTITLEDGGTAGSVTMTVDVASTVGIADMIQLYLNFDDSFSLANLAFAYSAGSPAGPEDTGISLGSNAFQSDGDGKYDILFDFPTQNGSRFNADESVVYSITSSDAITASSFNFLSDEAGGEGTYLVASKWLSTGADGEASAWIGTTTSFVPVPSSIWLFSSGIIGTVIVARRKNQT